MNPADTSETKPWTTSQVALATLLVDCVFLSFWLLYRFRAVIFILYIAIAIGTTIRSAVEWFYRRGLSRPAGIIIIYILIACILAGFLGLLSHARKYLKNPALSESMQWVNQLNQLVRQAITYMQKY